MVSPGFWLPGGALLRRRVAASCGPVSQLDALGHRLGDWVAQGAQAPPATVAGVEPYLAGYLELAARAGRRWGTAAGIVTGAGVGALLAVAAWVLSVLK